MKNDVVKIKIIKSGKSTYWYSGIEGQVFEVYDDFSSFIVKEDRDLGDDAIWRHIDKEDCEIVEGIE